MPLSVLLPVFLSIASTSVPATGALEAVQLSSAPDTAERSSSGNSDNKNKKSKKKGGGDGKKNKKGKKERAITITGGEFRNSAQVLKKGTIELHPLLEPSTYAVSNKLEIIAPLLGQLGGPQVAVRYSLLNKKQQDVAVEPYAISNWSFSGVVIGANLRYTKEIGRNRLNVGAGAGFSATLSQAEADAQAAQAAESGGSLTTSEIPTTTGIAQSDFELGYDLVTKDVTTWSFALQTDPYWDASGAASASIAAVWNHSLSKTFRVGLGVQAYIGGLPTDLAKILDALNITAPTIAVIPLPVVEAWWKF